MIIESSEPEEYKVIRGWNILLASLIVIDSSGSTTGTCSIVFLLTVKLS